MRLRLPLALACAVGLAGPLAAAPYSIALDFRISGVSVGELRVDGTATDSAYDLRARVTPSRLARAFIDFSFDGRAQGAIRDGRLIPSRYDAKSTSPRESRVTEIRWQGGVPTHVSVEPPRSTSPDPARQGGTVDPIAAGFALIRDTPVDSLCNTSVELFDGSRRSRLSLGSARETGDGRIACPGSFQRLEGEAHTMTSAKADSFRVVYDRQENGTARLWQIETRTKFGPAVLRRKGS